MSGNLTFEALTKQVADGNIDTVLVCFPDMQGRLMGKRFHAQNFIDTSHKETHCCNYLLATDLEMSTPEGYAATSWEKGYGDYVMKPDLSTIRYVPWLEGTAMVLSDMLDHHGDPVPHSPRAILKKQINRMSDLGFDVMTATELEFFIFENTVDDIRKSGFTNLNPISGYNEDYHILQTTKEEGIMRPIRNHLFNAGIPIENSKGEAEAGQEELNIRYADALSCSDYHTVAKNGIKEIAWQQGYAATFLPKWDHNRVGSSAHVHQSLWKDGEPVFFDQNDPLGMSDVMRHYMAGLIKYSSDYTWFLAPYVNSYKRFTKGSFAPTKQIWSVDNRTAAFRLCGANTKGIRVECRIGGSDINPYLAIAAQLAAGIKGIEDKLELAPPADGDVYKMASEKSIPATLREATEILRNSTMLQEAMGKEVIEHYTRAAEWEQEEFDSIVTNWEIARGFERC